MTSEDDGEGQVRTVGQGIVGDVVARTVQEDEPIPIQDYQTIRTTERSNKIHAITAREEA